MERIGTEAAAINLAADTNFLAVAESQSDRPAGLRPVAWAVWFARTRPWLTCAATVSTALLALIVVLEPEPMDWDVEGAEGSVATVTDMRVHRAFRVDESGMPIHPAADFREVNWQDAGETNTVVQADYTTESTEENVVRPVGMTTAVAHSTDGAWLTGTIEEVSSAEPQSANRQPVDEWGVAKQ